MSVPDIRVSGFTLVEVLVAMAITALVSTIAYLALSAALSGAESARNAARRMGEINRAIDMMSRDIRQGVNRSVLDEFGQRVPALMGGEAARIPLTLTRAGWHNSVGAPRSTLQRVEWRLEEDTLIRAHYSVLDRTTGTEAIETPVLEGVEAFELLFLPALAMLESDRDDRIDYRNWQDNWLSDEAGANSQLPAPAAIEVLLSVAGLGDIRRVYALPGN